MGVGDSMAMHSRNFVLKVRHYLVFWSTNVIWLDFYWKIFVWILPCVVWCLVVKKTWFRFGSRLLQSLTKISSQNGHHGSSLKAWKVVHYHGYAFSFPTIWTTFLPKFKRFCQAQAAFSQVCSQRSCAKQRENDSLFQCISYSIIILQVS